MIVGILFFLSINLFAEQINLSVTPSSYAKMKIVVGICKPHDHELQIMAPVIKKALEFTDQFSVQILSYEKMPTKNEILDLWKANCPYLFFLDKRNPRLFEWRLYDTNSLHMVKGKIYEKRDGVVRSWAYGIADAWWQELTGATGFFSQRLAYCKEVSHGKHRHKHIYIADYDGSHEEVVVATPTINVAPAWNTDRKRPMIFYSESTNTNLRMMAATLQGTSMMASNFDGLNMCPTFSQDGKTVVYCASRAKGNCQLYCWQNHELHRITHNEGNNICPCLVPDGRIFFASDFATGQPSIFVYEPKNKKIEQLTAGYCVSPTYCANNDTLAYSKMVNGIMQLWVYDFKTKEHQQLTNDLANKELCCWTHDGIHLLCPVATTKGSRIAYFNIITKKYQFMSTEKDSCSYPAISGIYDIYPTRIS